MILIINLQLTLTYCLNKKNKKFKQLIHLFKYNIKKKSKKISLYIYEYLKDKITLNYR